MADPSHLIVGTYARLGGAGLMALTAHDAVLSIGAAIPGIVDASWGVRAARSGRFFFVTEQTDGRVAAWRGDASGWQALGDAATGGAAPCHLALNRAETLLAAANYESGSVALFRIARDAPLGGRPDAHHQLVGHGPNAERQDGPHAHWVGFSRNGQWLWCVDLGTDRILRFAVDADAATLGQPVVAHRAPAGTGPRHLALHPTAPLAFLVSELASTLTELAIDRQGCFTPLQTVSTLPPGVTDSLGGAIAVNAAGDRLHVTNRGHDSIAVFAIKGRELTLLQHVPSGGASPRFLLLRDQARRLFVANEEGGTVCQFAIGDDGTLTPQGEPLAVPGAVFLAADPRAALRI